MAYTKIILLKLKVMYRKEGRYMEFNPIGKFKKSYEAGGRAYREGVKISDNPLLNQPSVGMAAWWETGWLHEKANYLHSKGESR